MKGVILQVMNKKAYAGKYGGFIDLFGGYLGRIVQCGRRGGSRRIYWNIHMRGRKKTAICSHIWTRLGLPSKTPQGYMWWIRGATSIQLAFFQYPAYKELSNRKETHAARFWMRLQASSIQKRNYLEARVHWMGTKYMPVGFDYSTVNNLHWGFYYILFLNMEGKYWRWQ